jgi:hypothetical protein
LFSRANPGVDAEDLRVSLARMMDPVEFLPPGGAAENALSSGRTASGTIG